MRIGQDLIDGRREGGHVLRHEKAGDAVAHDLLDAARSDRHDRQPRGHRLEDGQALRLAGRGEHERVRRLVEHGHAVGRRAAPELHAPSQPQRRRHVAQPGCLHPPPHQEQPHPRRFDAGHRAQQELEVLLAVQAPDVEEHAILGRESQGLAGGSAVARPEAAEVDSGRQHLDGSAHALRPEPPRDEVRRGDHPLVI